jgi:hypothetical protein
MKNKTIKLRRPFFDISLWAATVLGVFIVLSLYFVSPDFIPICLLFGVFLLLGLGLPRWQAKKENAKRAMIAKVKEHEKWGFHSRDREGPWINYVDYPLIRASQYAEGKQFYSEWLIIHNGLIIVNPGLSLVNLNDNTVNYDFSVKHAYAWDGCTPKRWFFWLVLIGTPDWAQKIEDIRTIDNETPCKKKEQFWQQAHHASLVHDALYQYLDSIPIPKRDVDNLFHEILIESGFSSIMAKIYHLAVRYLGARDVGENDPKSNTELALDRTCAELLAIQAPGCKEPYHE